MHVVVARKFGLVTVALKLLEYLLFASSSCSTISAGLRKNESSFG